jgi:micrococcal nuclease
MSPQKRTRPLAIPPYRLLALLLSCYACVSVAEEYYRWQDAEGQAHYSDTPPARVEQLQPTKLRLQQPLYQVEKVIDGDTIFVKHKGKVRLLGINAPEIAHRDRRAEPLGDVAHQRLQQLLQGKQVYLEFDQQRRDKYQRLLAHITLEDGTNINEILLREGLARALFLQPNMLHLQDYYRVEAEAMAARHGIWSRPEFQILPASRAEACLKRFCRLRGKVRKVEQNRHYTTLQLTGKVQLAVRNSYLPQFLNAGMDLTKLGGSTVLVRGWLGQRGGAPYLQLQHPLQIKLTPP